MTFDAGACVMPDDRGAAPAGYFARHNPGERRGTYRALAYWEELCAGASLPSEPPTIDDTVPDELRDSLFVINLRTPAEASVIAVAGNALRPFSGRDAAGLSLSQALPYGLSETFGDLTRVISTYGKPVLNSGAAQTRGGRMVLYRSIMLPLGDAGGRVVAVLGAIGSRPLPLDA